MASLTAMLLGIAWSASAEETAESVPWDQKTVTDLAKGLATTLSDAEDAFRNEPGNAMPTGDRRARLAVKQDLRRLRQEAKHLARELESGMGHDETLDIFLNLQATAYRTANNGQRAALIQPALDRVAAARAELTKLAPYYGETWTPVMNPR